LPHNGAVVTLLAVCESTHRESCLDIVMVGIVGALIALVAVIVLGSTFGHSSQNEPSAAGKLYADPFSIARSISLPQHWSLLFDLRACESLYRANIPAPKMTVNMSNDTPAAGH
jgi:hypothetical protein